MVPHLPGLCFRICTLWSVLMVLAAPQLPGQKFHLTHYEQGVPGERVTALAHDSQGYLWVATDAGLFRCDGTDFEPYNRHLPSVYIRYLLPEPEGILFSHDAGIHRITPGIDSCIVQPVLATAEEDIRYPNRLFRDRSGRLWISQPGGRISCQSSDSLVHFDLGPASHTGHSESHFSFAEPVPGHLWIASETGILYYFDNATGTILRRDSIGRASELLTDNEALWLAGDGLHHIQLTPDFRAIAATREWQIGAPFIRAASRDSTGTFWLGLDSIGLHTFRISDGAGSGTLREVFANNNPHRVDPLPYRTINQIRLTGENQIWIAGNIGCGVLQKRFFESVDGLPNGNTTTIVPADTGLLFVNFGDIFRIEKQDNSFRSVPLPSLQRGSITSLAVDSVHLWAGTSTGELLLLNFAGELQQTANLQERGEGIFFLYPDRRHRLWICQAPEETPIFGLACWLPDGRIRDYGREAGFENRIHVIREAPNGRLYVAGIGATTYLYRFLPDEDRFVNMSLPFDFRVGSNFEVHDMAIDAEGRIWLATTDGLLRHDLDRVRRIDLGSEFRAAEIRAVSTLADGSIWLSTETSGMLRLANNEILSLGEESGLPAPIMTYRGLLSDRVGRIWAGTSEGIVFSYDPLPRPTISPTPHVTAILQNEMLLRVPPKIRTDDTLNVHFRVPAFHGYQTLYSYRITDSVWTEVGTQRSIQLTQLPPGQYNLQIRAQLEGGYTPGQPVEIPLVVYQPWYHRVPWLWLAAVGLVVFLLLRLAGARRRALHSIRALRGQLLQERRYAATPKAPPADRELEFLHQILQQLHTSSDRDKLIDRLAPILFLEKSISGIALARPADSFVQLVSRAKSNKQSIARRGTSADFPLRDLMGTSHVVLLQPLQLEFFEDIPVDERKAGMAFPLTAGPTDSGLLIIFSTDPAALANRAHTYSVLGLAIGLISDS